MDLLQPKKADALSYLDSGAAAPVRYARAVVQFGATSEPYIQEFQVGPLPVANGTTTLAPLNAIYNKGKGYQRIYNIDALQIAAFTYQIATGVADLTQLLLNGVSQFLHAVYTVLTLMRRLLELQMTPWRSPAVLH